MATKYQQLANTLREQIAAGTFSATGLLPTEKAIAEAYQLSRQTVRQALSVLVQEGLIEKRQGSGSHIRNIPIREPVSAPRSVAVLTTYISDYIFPSILREVESVLSANHCTTLVFATKTRFPTSGASSPPCWSCPSWTGCWWRAPRPASPTPIWTSTGS